MSQRTVLTWNPGGGGARSEPPPVGLPLVGPPLDGPPLDGPPFLGLTLVAPPFRCVSWRAGELTAGERLGGSRAVRPVRSLDGRLGFGKFIWPCDKSDINKEQKMILHHSERPVKIKDITVNQSAGIFCFPIRIHLFLMRIRIRLQIQTVPFTKNQCTCKLCRISSKSRRQQSFPSTFYLKIWRRPSCSLFKSSKATVDHLFQLTTKKIRICNLDSRTRDSRSIQTVLLIRIRNPVPFLTPGSGTGLKLKNQDEQSGSYFRELKNHFFGLNYLNY